MSSLRLKPRSQTTCPVYNAKPAGTSSNLTYQTRIFRDGKPIFESAVQPVPFTPPPVIRKPSIFPVPSHWAYQCCPGTMFFRFRSQTTWPRRKIIRRRSSFSSRSSNRSAASLPVTDEDERRPVERVCERSVRIRHKLRQTPIRRRDEGVCSMFIGRLLRGIFSVHQF